MCNQGGSCNNDYNETWSLEGGIRKKKLTYKDFERDIKARLETLRIEMLREYPFLKELQFNYKITI